MNNRLSNPLLRRAQRVLLMVHELHKLGYQRIRIAPGLSPSGAYWRCAITPVSNISSRHGAELAPEANLDEVAQYSTGQSNEYFEWKDAKADTARELAQKFLQRFPFIVRKGEGADWEYAGWFVQMLGFAEKGLLPIAYAEYLKNDGIYMHLTGPSSRERLPVPPLVVEK